MFESESAGAVTSRPFPGIGPHAPTGEADVSLPADLCAQRMRPVQGRLWRSLAVLAEVGVALPLCKLAAHRHPGFAPFILLYPAVLGAALLDGLWAGIAVTVLSTIAAEAWLSSPWAGLPLQGYDALSLAMFFVFGIVLSGVLELYHRNRERLAAYQVGQAVLRERISRQEEQRLAASIRAERQRLYDVLDTLPHMISLLRPDFRVIFANRSFREKFGDPGDQCCFESRHGRAEACEGCEAFTPLRTGQPHRHEVRLADQTTIEAYNLPFRDLDGSVLILEMGIDITERRRTEMELKAHREHLEELVAERTRQWEDAHCRLQAEITRLKQAQAELGESRATLNAALSSMADSVIITDGEGRFVEFNDAFARFYRFPSKAQCVTDFAQFAELIEVSTMDEALLRPEDFPMCRALRGETGSNVEYGYRRRDTGECWFGSVSFSPIRAQDGTVTGAVVSARDVTQRRMAESDLAAARLQAERAAAQLRTIFDSVEERLYVCDAEGNGIMFNGVSRRSYGDPLQVPSIREMENLIDVFDLEGRRLALPEWPVARVVRGESIHAMEIEVRFRASNQQRILSCNGAAIRDQNGNIVMAVLTSTDITERKATEEALRRGEKVALQREQFQALAERLRRVREEERTRVARDLHDQIGQILTAIKFELMWMSRRLPGSKSEFRDRLEAAVGLLNEGVRSVRTICSGLRPGVLDDLGLAAAIEWQANEFAARTGINCAIAVPAFDVGLSGDQATEFFRIFQEALTNVMRHAEAKSALITLQIEAGDLVLIVRDDGKGFSESEVAGSLGFLGMKERAQVCGGDLEICSSPGTGTMVTLRVPIQAASTTGDEDADPDCR